MARSRLDGKSTEPGEGPRAVGLALLVTDWMTEEYSSLRKPWLLSPENVLPTFRWSFALT